jgi:hypothetical protein
MAGTAGVAGVAGMDGVDGIHGADDIAGTAMAGLLSPLLPVRSLLPDLLPIIRATTDNRP